MNLSDDLLDLERAGWDSLCRGTGAAFYGSIMTDDAVMVLANGMVMDRDQVAASLSEAPPWDAYDIDVIRTIPASDDVACLIYVGTGHRGESTFVGVMSSTYVRHGARWKLALYHQTEHR